MARTDTDTTVPERSSTRPEDAELDRPPTSSSAPVVDDPPPEARPSGPRIGLTPAARDVILEMMDEEELPEEGGLRLTARMGAGCSAPLDYGMFLEPAPEDDDQVLRGDGIRIFLDPEAAWILDGLLIDYVDSPEMGEGFAFRHPHGRRGRAC